MRSAHPDPADLIRRNVTEIRRHFSLLASFRRNKSEEGDLNIPIFDPFSDIKKYLKSNIKVGCC